MGLGWRLEYYWCVVVMDDVSPSNSNAAAGGAESEASSSKPWSPAQLAFSPYFQSRAPNNLRVLVRRPVSHPFLLCFKIHNAFIYLADSPYTLLNRFLAITN